MGQRTDTRLGPRRPVSALQRGRAPRPHSFVLTSSYHVNIPLLVLAAHTSFVQDPE